MTALKQGALKRKTAGDTSGTVRRLRRHGRATPWAFLTPYLLFCTAFILVPAVFGLWISLHDWSFTAPNKPFVGLQNYLALFTEGGRDTEDFWRSMAATGLFVVLSVPVLIVIPLLVALALNRPFRGRTFYRAVFFAPYVLSVAVVGVLWRFLLDTHVGIINRVLAMVGLPGDISWTQSQPAAWFSLVTVTLWWTLGFNTIVILAGLQSIPSEQYEAASLDGAGAFNKFLYVTLPGLRSVFVFVFVMTVLASANLFGQPYIITQGGPENSTRTAVMYMSEVGLRQFRMGNAAAMSYILALCLVLVSVISFVIIGRKKD